ncbi:hypothetical protein BTA51_00890 [Hahella sp. CCB-MM4]|uniref:VRR-NUC domain-containing protein n=1 Tax=Hahella sp. (strain CCB-MM4) TaxID=1926491 RepID=UPI000B9AB0E5|nr:VRR-NUC domain-containing protein [Hahella sp. CCB-MM4]OZG74990.1 hypothetical protein BTA51_00890 [Hahella sp. CCB-MM4]
MTEPAAVELDPFYYLYNFRTLLECVLEQYGDLLNNEEQEFVDTFMELPDPEQALLVRMYSRRSTLFRSDKLNYTELPPTEHLLPSLQESGLISINPMLPAEELLELVTCPEMREWWPEQCPKKGNRPFQLEQLAELTSNQFYDSFPHTLVEILHQPMIDLFQLLFFGNLAQDLSAFVTVDLGHVRYEPYQLDSDTRLFRHRQDIDDSEAIMALRDQFYSSEEFDPDIAQHILQHLPVLDDNSPVKGRLSRLCNRIGKGYEQQQMLPEALEAYSFSHRPPARERRARILFKLEQYEAAENRCKEIIKNPWNEAESLFAERFQKQCRKQMGHKGPPNRRYTPQTQTLVLPNGDMRVEQNVLMHLYLEESPCFYVENWLMNTVFGLTFWDAIFAPVRGAFTHPFQRAPHDLFDTEFESKRHPLIESAFDNINSASWSEQITQRWRDKYGISNPFVGWYEPGEDILSMALDYIPREHWMAIFRRMLSDLRENCSGFPDLIQFYEDGSYRLLEVKSPTDKVQPNQLRWMSMFEQQGIPYHLLQVKWAEQSIESLS